MAAANEGVYPPQMEILRQRNVNDRSGDSARSVHVDRSYKTAGWNISYIDTGVDRIYGVADDVPDLDDAIAQATKWAEANGRDQIVVQDFLHAEKRHFSHVIVDPTDGEGHRFNFYLAASEVGVEAPVTFELDSGQLAKLTARLVQLQRIFKIPPPDRLPSQVLSVDERET